MVNGKTLSVIVQGMDAARTAASCGGFPGLPAAAPTRLLLVSDTAQRATRDKLRREVLRSMGRIGGSARCDNTEFPRSCFAEHTEGVRHVLVVVGGDTPPTAELEKLVTDWKGEAIGVFRTRRNPDVVLPAALHRLHAPSWTDDVREVAGEIADLALLGTENRRVFISYARADGTRIAEKVADELFRRRFDVYLDKLQLTPGDFFIEHLADAIVDKAMVLVIETPAAVDSKWVHREIHMADTHGIGVVAVSRGRRQIDAISNEMRRKYRNPNQVAEFVLEQHRVQWARRRDGMFASVQQALRNTQARDLRRTAEGFRFEAGPLTHAVTIRPRPADMHRLRLADERSGPAQAVFVHPRPKRADRLSDLVWAMGNAGIADVDSGDIEGGLGVVMKAHP